MNNYKIKMIMKLKRQGDESDLDLDHLRCRQFISRAEGIYFKTREDYSFGPYATLEQAKIARQFFIDTVTGQLSEISHLYPMTAETLVPADRIIIDAPFAMKYAA